MSMRRYMDEMTDFKMRQLRLLGRAEKAVQEHAEALLASPELGVINSVKMFEFAAMRKVALTFLDQFGLYESDPSDWNPGDKPKRFFNMFCKQCENELIARAKTPRDIPLGEQLFYDALREHYAGELVYLSARKNFLEREES